MEKVFRGFYQSQFFNFFSLFKQLPLKIWAGITNNKSNAALYNSHHNITPTKARIHGYLCADGNVRQYNKSGEIRFFTNEKALTEIFRKSIEEVYGVIPYLSPSSPQNRGCFEVRTKRKEIFQDLLKYGKFGIHSWMPPTEIFDDKKATREWIKAFFDGEAYINLKKVRIQVKSVNGKGLRLVCDLLLKHFDVHAKLYGPYRQRNSNHTPYYQLYGCAN